MKTTIVQEGDREDLRVVVRRVGRVIVLTTDRATVAKSVERAVIDSLGGKDKPDAIGFQAD